MSNGITPGTGDPGTAGGEMDSQAAVPILTLEVPRLPDGTVNPSTTVRWGINEALNRQIISRGYQNPYVAIVVRSAREEWGATYYVQMRRYVVPLRNGQQHVVFTRPGVNEVRAVIVERPSGETLRDFRKNTAIFSEFKNPDTDQSRFNDPDVRCIEASQTAVECVVSAEHFAPEPPAWQRNLVGHFEGLLFGRTLKDQCHHKQRLIIGMFATFFVVTLGEPVRALTLAASLLVGRRHTQWNGMRPFNFDNTPWGVDRSIYYADKRSRTRKGLWVWLMIVNPATVLPLWVLTYLIMHHSNRYHWGFLESTLAVVAWFAFCVLVISCAQLGDVARKAQRRRSAAKQRRRWAQLSKSTVRPAEQDTRALQLQLNGVTVHEDGTLPVPRTTLGSAWWEVKDRVCKPFPERPGHRN